MEFTIGRLVFYLAVGFSLAACDGDLVSADGRIYPGGRLFGHSLSLEGEVMLASAVETNEAFVLDASRRSWATAARVRPSSPAIPDPRFGWSVALGVGVAVVGSPEGGHGQTSLGAAYVYERSPSGGWAEAAALRPATLDGRALFGWTVATSAGRVAVGAPADGFRLLDPERSDPGGSVYVFGRDGQAWRQTARIANPSPHRGQDAFGGTVAMSGDRLAVSGGPLALTGATDSGVVRVFEPVGDSWNETARLLPLNPAGSGPFGERMAMDGPTLAVLAPRQQKPGVPGIGVVHVFRERDGTWTREAELIPEDLDPRDAFGQALSVSGDRLAVGVFSRAGVRGAVFVYARQPSGAWTLEAELRTAAGREEGFGHAVALDGDRLLATAIGAGSFRGAVCEFRREGGVWRQVTR